MGGYRYVDIELRPKRDAKHEEFVLNDSFARWVIFPQLDEADFLTKSVDVVSQANLIYSMTVHSN